MHKIGQNINCLLLLLRLAGYFVEDSKVAALSGGERDSIRVLVLGRNVEVVDSCGEGVGVCKCHHEGTHSVIR